MLADFRYCSVCLPHDVVVAMYWDDNVQMGQVQLPDDVDEAVRLADLPGGKVIPLVSAVAYALLIAGKTGRNLRISGDRSVWPTQWGQLVDVA